MGYKPRSSDGGGGGGSPQAINDQTGNGAYTFVLSDAGKIVVLDQGVTHVLPANSNVAFPVGTFIDVVCNGAIASYQFASLSAAGPPTINGINGITLFPQVIVRLQQTAVDVWSASYAQGAAQDGIPKFAGGNQGLAVAGTDYSLTLQQALAASGITPCPDGTVTPVTSITTVNGIITAIS